MNQSERSKIGELWLGLAAMYGKELNKVSLKLMLDAVDDLDYEKILSCLNDWAKTSKSGRHPFPSEIREKIFPTMSIDGQANEIASRIREAISRHGWCNDRLAMDSIGPLGWVVVDRCGGWKHLCENHGLDLNPLTFHAQARDILKSIIENKKIAEINSNQIDYKNSNEKLLSLNSSLIKEMPK